MIIRIAIAALVIAAVFLLWRNIGAREQFRIDQRKAWDEPWREGSATVLAATAASWWWLLALAGLTALVGRMLFERMTAGAGVGDTLWHWILFVFFVVVCARRAVQLSEKVTVTWDRMTSRNLLGERWTVPVDDVTGVSETDRSAAIALKDGRVIELPPWLEGRFWLARELKARLG